MWHTGILYLQKHPMPYPVFEDAFVWESEIRICIEVHNFMVHFIF